MKIPFVDLKAKYYRIKEEIDTAMQDFIEHTTFIKGKHVDDFEKKFALRKDIENLNHIKPNDTSIEIT